MKFRGCLTLCLLAAALPAVAQHGLEFRWMAVGSLHTFFASLGTEPEEVRVSLQQDGWRWPANRPYQDIQASKCLWIGAKNYTAPGGTFFPRKVVHAGPRTIDTLQFFPLALTSVNRFEPTRVTVGGVVSSSVTAQYDSIDPDLDADRMITNSVNTALGITITRRIKQFSHPLHDNYILQEYEFTNTGNLDADPDIEQPGVALDSLYFYFLYRLAICADTRYVIGNATGWGINTMLDARGDGVRQDPADQQFRAQYAWHGYYPQKDVPYDNIGGPIWAGYNDKSDTVGRLGAAQFAGVLTVHADRSAADTTDDPAQPSTTSWEGSDEPLTSQNSQFNITKMTQEYDQWILRGHRSPRHAYAVEPTGNFSQPMGDPALGTPGGFSIANGYGPYHIGPGESVRIVIADVASGLDRNRCLSVGKLFKQGLITARAKNDSVLTGRDSLFQTFRRVLASHAGAAPIAHPPLPPQNFAVTATDSGITLTWDLHTRPGPPILSYRIYRAERKWEGDYTLLRELDASARSFTDTTAVKMVPYYYHILSVGDSLVSSSYYTQTYTPVYDATVGVEENEGLPASFSLEQNYPNPFNPLTTIRYSLPRRSMVRLSVFNTLGQETAVPVQGEQDAGYHEVKFNAAGLSSGVYFYRLQADGFVRTRKLNFLK